MEKAALQTRRPVTRLPCYAKSSNNCRIFFLPKDTCSPSLMTRQGTLITAQVYDLNHFPDLREKYQVMSVPCLVINDGEQVSFGKKSIRQLLELLT